MHINRKSKAHTPMTQTILSNTKKTKNLHISNAYSERHAHMRTEAYNTYTHTYKGDITNHIHINVQIHKIIIHTEILRDIDLTIYTYLTRYTCGNIGQIMEHV